MRHRNGIRLRQVDANRPNLAVVASFGVIAIITVLLVSICEGGDEGVAVPDRVRSRHRRPGTDMRDECPGLGCRTILGRGDRGKR